MQTWMIILIVSIVVLAAAAWIIYDRRRTRRLQDRFGPAYDQTVSEIGNRRRAEAELEAREHRARQLSARPLDPSDCEKYMSEWKLCQAQFVDDPPGAVDTAARLVTEVMRTRGYSTDTPHGLMTDVAAAYPHHAERYRQAVQIIASHRQSPVSTAELRTAFLYYRALFDELLGGYDEKLKRAA
jgi:hypothetical protein